MPHALFWVGSAHVGLKSVLLLCRRQDFSELPGAGLGFAPTAVVTEVSAAEVAAQQNAADSWGVSVDSVSQGCSHCSPSLLPRQNDHSLEPWEKKRHQSFTTLLLRTPAYKALSLLTI